jgi:lipid II:glycine glycyltransferase (peptidoglycan interpeptide bridge formation enzyme)
MATPLIAEVDSEAVAAIVLFHFAKRAWYIHGMSRNVHREKMPNHLVQWEAMRTAKALGCEVYDLWGAPNEFSVQDPMWGVYQFKRGLGGTVVRTMGAYDLPIRPRLYWLYTRLLPRILAVMRRRGREQTAQALNQ